MWTRGEGVKKSKIFVDIINGSPSGAPRGSSLLGPPSLLGMQKFHVFRQNACIVTINLKSTCTLRRRRLRGTEGRNHFFREVILPSAMKEESEACEERTKFTNHRQTQQKQANAEWKLENGSLCLLFLTKVIQGLVISRSK